MGTPDKQMPLPAGQRRRARTLGDIVGAGALGQPRPRARGNTCGMLGAPVGGADRRLAHQRRAIPEHQHGVFRVRRPGFIIRQRLWFGNHRHPVAGVVTSKIDAHVVVHQVRHAKRRLPQVVQVGAAMGEQHVAIAEHEVRTRHGRGCWRPVRARRRSARPAAAVRQTLAQGFQQVAERGFRVGVAHWPEILAARRGKVLRLPLMGKNPVAPPQLAVKRVECFPAPPALGGLADVGDDVFGFDRVTADQIRHWRVRAGLVVQKQPAAYAFKEAMPNRRRAGRSARRAGESPQKKTGCPSGVAVHAQQLAHGVTSWMRRRLLLLGH